MDSQEYLTYKAVYDKYISLTANGSQQQCHLTSGKLQLCF